MPGRRWIVAVLACVGTELAAQSVLLELRPREGDTLRMRLDQSTETVASRKGTVPMQATTVLRMFSRAIVEGRTANATLIFAITDSVELTSSDAHARRIVDDAERQLKGRQMRLRLAPNGTVSLGEGARDVPRAVSELVSVMPASFPSQAVVVGDTWVREMPIPPGVRLGVPIGGMVRSTFRLDSLARDGRFAYVSMRGTMHPVIVGVMTTAAIGGSVDGNMVVDRRRGWLSESRFLIQMRTTVESKDGRVVEPMQFRTTITQRMRVEKRP
jgi:hypothetical protein